MTLHLGNVPASSTLYIPFTTYDKTNGASVTMTGLATTDIEIYKNGSTTQRASEAGYALLDTDGIDFDSITGLHGFSIDLADNTDAGFYAVGSFYWVVVSTITIDSQTVTFIPATFRIVAAENTAGYPVADAAKLGGTTVTGRDIGTSVLLSSGTGTGQLDFTSGVVKSNLAQILGTALTETSGLIAAAFKKFFNVATPTGTVNSLADAVPGAAGGGFIAGTNAATTITTALTTTFTGDLTGSVGTVAANGITATSMAADAINAAAIKTGAITNAKFAAGAIDAAAIAAGAIDNATFAADVGSTAYATNIIALAVDKALGNYDPPTNTEFEARTIAAADYVVVGDTIAAVTSVTNGVTLADDAITAAKFDESTAYPVKAADSGATYIARTGADSDTLEALSDEIAAVSTLIGTPANIDSGGATLADNLKKIADDNGGASFDATVSSLNKLSTAVITGVATTLQATANTETTGTLISGTYASTYLSNGTSWVTAPVTPAVAEAGSALSPFGLNVNLRYTAGTGQTINSVSIRGNFAAGPGRYVNVYAYNYITTTWDMLSDVGTRMNNTGTLTTYTYTLLSSHQKTDVGGDGVGAIRIGFKSPSTTTGDRLNVDLALVNVATAGASAADIADAVYAKMATSIYGRQVWIDTVNGVDGYVIGINGLDHTPVKTIACAYQLCDDLGLKTISFKSGSNATAVTLTRSAAGWRFYGPGKIDLNGQSIADAIFDECYSVYGTSTGDDASFYRCQIGSGGLTLDHVYVTACRIKGAITLIANADPIIFHDCIDATGAGADFELIFVANATAVIRNFQGALTLKSMAATNSIVIDGALRVTIDGSCTAGSITVRGFAPALTGAAAFITAGGTITQDARYSTDAINAEVDAALNTAIPGSPTADSINERIATMDAGVNVSAISGDTAAADRLEAMLDASPTGAVVDEDDPNPSATAFETNLAEATSDHYNGAFVVFYSGALLGQSRKISDYDGTTKVLTVLQAFTEAPAAGDTFMILGRSE